MNEACDNTDASAGRRRFLTQLGAAGAASIFPMNLLHAQAASSTLRVRMGGDIALLDPAKIFGQESQTVSGNIYNGLVKYDQASNKIVPDLARSWETSSDGTVYTFRLRDKVTWHKNFGPFTSDDVKFSLERVLAKATGSPYAGQIGSIKSVETPDRLTARIVLHQPNAGFLHKVSAFNQGWLVSRKAVTEIGEKYSLQPIGTGPFVFERWTPGSDVRLVANKAYFEGAPKLSEVIFRVIRDETAAAIALENREIDVFYQLNQPDVIGRLSKAKGITLLNRPANNTSNLVLNTTIKPLDDVRVRRAMAHAMNRKGLIDGFFKGTKGEAHTVLTPSFPENTPDVPRYPYDPAKARALLKEAGVSSFKFVITSLTLFPYDKMVVPLASDLSEVGIKTTLQIFERGAYTQARSKGDIMSCITGVSGPPDPDSPLVTLFSTKSFPPGLNTMRYNKADALLAKASATLDPAARTAVYRELVKQIMTDLPLIPVFEDRLYLAHTETVRGFVQNSLTTMQAYSVSLKR